MIHSKTVVCAFVIGALTSISAFAPGNTNVWSGNHAANQRIGSFSPAWRTLLHSSTEGEVGTVGQNADKSNESNSNSNSNASADKGEKEKENYRSSPNRDDRSRSYGNRNPNSDNRNGNTGTRSFGNNSNPGNRNFGNNGNQGTRSFGNNGNQGTRSFGNNGNQGNRNFGSNGNQGNRNFGNNQRPGANPGGPTSRSFGARPAGGGGGALKLSNPMKLQRIVVTPPPFNGNRQPREGGGGGGGGGQNRRSPPGGDRSAGSKRPGWSSPDAPAAGASSDTGRGDGRRNPAAKGRKEREPGADKRNTRNRTVLRVGTGKRGRAASLSMGRSSLRKRDRSAQKAARAEAAEERRTVDLPDGPVSVANLAEIIDEKPIAIIKYLMTDLGVMASMTQNLDPPTAAAVAEGFGKIVGGEEYEDDEDDEDLDESALDLGFVAGDDDEEDLVPRAPVVTIMGHVDHGKTSLLDALRNTRVTAGEAGGITQHIAAYQVKHAGNDITFIDTPGHAAFTDMRERGANITDIVILVVAADDGVKKQTVDSIACARQAGVPVIVAINKIDLETADVMKVQTELTGYDLLTEAFGGDVLCSEISAKEGTNLDDLLDKIMLQAEIQDLKANPDRDAEAIIIEAKVERGLGTVATALVKKGTLRVGDSFLAGETFGKVRALISTNDGKTRFDEVGPSVPIRIVGFDGIPSAGDILVAAKDEQTVKSLAANRQRISREKSSVSYQSNLMSSISTAFSATKELREMCVVVKADVQGTAEALTRSLRELKLEDEEAIVTVKVLVSEAGEINKRDVAIASVTPSTTIIAFNVAASFDAMEEARMSGIPIEYYNVVYDAIESVESRMQEVLSPTPEGEYTGSATVQEVFNIGGLGNIAGSRCTDGFLRKGANVRVMRGDKILIESVVKTLRNFKADADTIEAGNECGIGLLDFEDYQPDDVIECYVQK